MTLQEVLAGSKAPAMFAAGDYDGFAATVDDALEYAEGRMELYSPAGQKGWEVTGTGCGPVIDLFIMLTSIKPVYKQMIRQLPDIIRPSLAKAIGELVRDALLEAMEEDDGGD